MSERLNAEFPIPTGRFFPGDIRSVPSITFPTHSEVDKTLAEHDLLQRRRKRREKLLFEATKPSPEKQAMFYAEQTLQHLPSQLQTPILDGIAASLEGQQSDNRAKLLTAVLNSPNSLAYGKATSEFVENPTLLHHEGLYPLLTTLLQDPQRFLTPLGLIFSQIGLTELPPSVRSEFSTERTTHDIKLAPFHKNWYLCERAEPVMEESTKNKVVTLIGDQGSELFYTNFRIKMYSLCLTNFETPEGKIFFKGCYYCPTDDETRNTLLSACDADKGRIPLPTSSSWAFMRPMNRFTMTTLEDYKAHAAGMPTQWPFPDVRLRSEQMSRRVYRDIGLESMDK